MKTIFIFLMCSINIGFIHAHEYYYATLYDKIEEAKTFYRQKNYKESFKAFKKISKKIPEAACWYLGEQYYNGWGTKQNIEKAIRYYEIGAIFNSPFCEERLSSHYFSNLNDNYNQSKAFYWSKTASLNPAGVKFGSPKTTYMLALCYLKGIGTPKDSLKAEIWMTLSAILGYKDAVTCYKKKYNMNSDIVNPDSADVFLANLYNHLDSLILPYIYEDSSLAAKVIRCVHAYKIEDYKTFLSLAKELSMGNKISKIGNYLIFHLLYDYYKDYKYDLYNADIIEERKVEIGEIPLKEQEYWLIEQYVKCLEMYYR